MSTGAILLDSFDLAHLATLHDALVETSGEYEFAPESLAVSYSAGRVLGDALVLHIQPVEAIDREVEYEPMDFYAAVEEAGHFGPGDFATSLSGFFGDRFDDSEVTPTAYTCVYQPWTEDWVVEHGIYYTFEGRDAGPGEEPLMRLAEKRDFEGGSALKAKLQSPDTAAVRIDGPPPGELTEHLERLRS